MRPATEPTGSLIAELLACLPAARTGSTAVAAAPGATAALFRRLALLQTWFESSAEFHALLPKAGTHHRHVLAVLETIMPGRRSIWARHCAWAAMVLRDSAGPGRRNLDRHGIDRPRL